QAEVLQETRRRGGEVGLAVADEGDGAAAKVESAAILSADHLDATRVPPLLQRANRHGEGGYFGFPIAFQQVGQQVKSGGIDQRLVPLEVDDDINVEPAGDLGDAVGAAGMVAA